MEQFLKWADFDEFVEDTTEVLNKAKESGKEFYDARLAGRIEGFKEGYAAANKRVRQMVKNEETRKQLLIVLGAVSAAVIVILSVRKAPNLPSSLTGTLNVFCKFLTSMNDIFLINSFPKDLTTYHS